MRSKDTRASTRAPGGRLIVDGLRTGEPYTYELMYDRFAQRLYGYCRVMVADQAAEVVRDTLVTAARLPATLLDDEALTRRLFGLARTECRRRNPLRRRADPAAGLLDRSFADLRPDQREVLRLTGSGEMEVSDVADLLGVAADTADSLVQAAAKRLEQAAYIMLAAERVTWTADYHELVTALGAGTLPRLLAKNDPPLPPEHRAEVLTALGADSLGRVPDSPAVATFPPSKRGHRGVRRPRRVWETAGVAACATIAVASYVLWPAATGHGPDRLSLLGHSSKAAHRHPGSATPANPAAGTATGRAVRITPRPSPTTPTPASAVPITTGHASIRPRPSGSPRVPGTPSTAPTTPGPSVSPSETPSP